jgi:serine/threonine protein phosphatase PrpC
MNFKYKISVASDKGTRETNEDFYGILENHKDILLVLCDGVGSEQDSDIAAKITVKTFLTRFKKRFPLFFCFSRFYNNCIKASLRKLRKLTNKNQGMGTTLCVVYIHKNIAQCANIGDSRIYYYSASQKQ